MKLNIMFNGLKKLIYVCQNDIKIFDFVTEKFESHLLSKSCTISYQNHWQSFLTNNAEEVRTVIYKLSINILIAIKNENSKITPTYIGILHPKLLLNSMWSINESDVKALSYCICCKVQVYVEMFHKPRIFRIDFEPSNGVFYAGQLVSGRVYLVTDSFINQITGKFTFIFKSWLSLLSRFSVKINNFCKARKKTFELIVAANLEEQKNNQNCWVKCSR